MADGWNFLEWNLPDIERRINRRPDNTPRVVGHNNETVSDPRYLDLVTRGVLWVCDKLAADGKPRAGYAAK